MIIQILCDNPNSWEFPLGQRLAMLLQAAGHKATFIASHSEIASGDILCLLGCEDLLAGDKRSLNTHNLVVHASALPQGKGMSPLTWQILEGKNNIPVTLFEAADSIDSGDIYAMEEIEFKGHELIDELREKLSDTIIGLVHKFVSNYPAYNKKPQSGVSSYYKRRRPEDSRLDLDKTIREQFNLLRVVDNERYPAFFEIFGCKYIVKIAKGE